MIKMAETKVTNDNSGNQVKHSNPAVAPLPVSAGQAVVITGPASKPVIHGQVSGTSVVFDNPA